MSSQNPPHSLAPGLASSHAGACSGMYHPVVGMCLLFFDGRMYAGIPQLVADCYQAIAQSGRA